MPLNVGKKTPDLGLSLNVWLVSFVESLLIF